MNTEETISSEEYIPKETIYQARNRHRKELIEETLTYGHDYLGDETDR